MNLKKEHDRIPEMLEHSGGRRAVPVIVEDGKATVGFGGT